jgi:hypothetical protein
MMKNYVKILVIAFMTINFTSCVVYSTINTNSWLEYELPPSRIVKSGDVFFGGKFSDGNHFHVFSDVQIDDDASYYYSLLMQDFGWRKKDDKTWTAPYDSRERKLGCVYINPERRAAVYFWPEGTYSAFKVGFKDSSVPTEYLAQ